MFSLKTHAKSELGRLAPDLFLFFKKALNEIKASILQRSFNILRYPSTWHALKTNCIKR